MKRNTAIGKIACLCCGEAITVKQADTGTISVSCPDCDFSAYAKQGTEAHRLLMPKIKMRAVPALVTAPAPKPPTPSAKPAAHMPTAEVIRKNTVFG